MRIERAVFIFLAKVISYRSPRDKADGHTALWMKWKVKVLDSSWLSISCSTSCGTVEPWLMFMEPSGVYILSFAHRHCDRNQDRESHAPCNKKSTVQWESWNQFYFILIKQITFFKKSLFLILQLLRQGFPPDLELRKGFPSHTLLSFVFRSLF